MDESSVIVGERAISAPCAVAEEATFELKLNTTMSGVLTENTGKRVALKLESGDEVEGIVTKVGHNLVYVTRLAGKEFYDLVVSLDKISAVQMKLRDK